MGEENNNESDDEKTVKSSLIEFSSDTAKFLAQVFGETITDGVGIIGDKIKCNRYIRAADLHQKASKNLKGKGIKPETYRPIAAKIGIPLLENASLEEDDELHTLWSKLLANALDPNFSGDISFMHVSLLKGMMPLDVKILHIIFNTKNQKFSTIKLDEVSFSKAEIAKSLNTDINKIEISLLNLTFLPIDFEFFSLTDSITNPSVSKFSDEREFEKKPLTKTIFILSLIILNFSIFERVLFSLIVKSFLLILVTLVYFQFSFLVVG